MFSTVYMIFIMFISPPPCTCVLSDTHRSLWKLWLPSLGSKPPSYATGVVTRSFSASIPKWHSWWSKIQCLQLDFPPVPPPPPPVIVDVKSTPFQIFTSCMAHDHAITCSFLLFFFNIRVANSFAGSRR